MWPKANLIVSSAALDTAEVITPPVGPVVPVAKIVAAISGIIKAP